jgi:hypothetical protein
MSVIPMSRKPRTKYLDYSEFTEFIASTTSVIWIADSRSPFLLFVNMIQKVQWKHNKYLLLFIWNINNKQTMYFIFSVKARLEGGRSLIRA